MPPSEPGPSPPRLRRRPARRLRWMGLALACLLVPTALAAAWTRARTRAVEREHPRVGRTVRVGGLRQHVLVEGGGPDLVLVHGAYGTLLDLQRTLLPEAARAWRCVLWDRPGHGYSERPASPCGPGEQAAMLLELIDELALERPVLLGFSYGGAVALAAALEAPDRIGGLLLVAAPSHPWSGPLDPEVRLSGLELPAWLFSLTWARPLAALMLEDSLTRAFAPRPVPGDLHRGSVGLALRPDSLLANLEDLRLLRPFLARQVPRYPALVPPLVQVSGDQDRVVGPELHARRLHAAVPGAHLIVLDGAGHQLPYTHRQQVLEALDELRVRVDLPAAASGDYTRRR